MTQVRRVAKPRSQTGDLGKVQAQEVAVNDLRRPGTDGGQIRACQELGERVHIPGDDRHVGALARDGCGKAARTAASVHHASRVAGQPPIDHWADDRGGRIERADRPPLSGRSEPKEFIAKGISTAVDGVADESYANAGKARRVIRKAGPRNGGIVDELTFPSAQWAPRRERSELHGEAHQIGLGGCEAGG